MEFSISEKANKDRRSSIWKYLPGFSRKSRSEQIVNEQDVTLIAANRLYSSFHSLKHKKLKAEFEKERDGSAKETQDGIPFLTTDNQLRWRSHQEPKNKHVQFAPSPMNKYHSYRNSPCAGKENVDPTETSQSMKTDCESSQDRTCHETYCNRRAENSVSRRETFFREPRSDLKSKSMTLPRTSTKSNLGENPNVTSPNFNVSCITRESIGSRCGSEKSFKQTETFNHSANISGVLSLNRSEKEFVSESSIGIPFVPKMKQVRDVTSCGVELKKKDDGDEISNGKATLKIRPLQKQLLVSASNWKSTDANNSNGCSRWRSKPQSHETFILRTTGSARNSNMNPENNSELKSEYQNNYSKESQPFHVFGPKNTQLEDKISRAEHSVPNKSILTSEKTGLSCRGYTHHIFENALPDTHGILERSVCRDGDERSLGRKCMPLNVHHSYRAPSSFMHRKNAFLSFRKKYKPNELNSSVTVPSRAINGAVRSNCDSRKEKRYDGMSSLADDECSLNCSCYDCLETVSARSDEKRLVRRESLKDKLFFPEKSQDQPYRKIPSMKDPYEISGCWYECNDSMCQSPETNNSKERVQSTTRKNSAKPDMSTAYKSEDIFISEDYEINPGNVNREDYLQNQCAEKQSFKASTSSKSLNISNNQEKNFQTVKTITRCSSDMSPTSKKLSESCVFALQETLKNLMQDPSSKTSFTINSFDSNRSFDKPSTIVIQIQNTYKGADLSNACSVPGTCEETISNKKELKDRALDSPLSRARSMPEMHWNQVGDTSCLSSNIPPEKLDKDPLIAKDMSSTETFNLSSEVFEEPLDTVSNSGYSTISSSVSLYQKAEEDSTIHDKEILEELMRVGRGLPAVSPQKTPRKTRILSPKKHKFKAKDVLSGRAKLKLNIYNNYGMITVHVVKAVKLASVRTMKLNPYVKVSLHPDESRRAHWRTNVVSEESNPVFNQKFTFETVPEDSKKRLIFSVWHRDREKKRSEFLGCMSFGVYHVMGCNQSLSGWYRLLKEVVGTKKHFAAGQKSSFAKLLAR